MTKRNILAAWAASDLFSFNPERVLRKTPKPHSEVSIPTVKSCPQEEVLQVPTTPITPITTEAIMSLHKLIKQDTCNLDDDHRPLKPQASLNGW
jgi:hypothetical protein